MSDSTILIGYIEEFNPGSNERGYEYIPQYNDSVIKSLIDVKDGLPLSSHMFAIPGPEREQGQFRRNRIFPFGGTINYLRQDDEWNEWKAKFENLLRNLYWNKAEVWTRGGYSGPARYGKWDIDDVTVASIQAHPPQLPKTWIYSSEPEK